MNRKINHYCAPPLARVAILAVGTLISGCNRDAPAPAAKATKAPAIIRLLVVDEPSLVTAIQGIAGDWKAQSDSPLQVSAISAEEATTAEHLDADALIFPPELLGTLAERRLIRPLNRAWLTSDLLAADDLLTPLDSPELCWDGQPTAISLGEPVLLACYRTDVLERLGKNPPNTWDEYQQLVEQIGREHRLRPTAEPLAGGWAARMLLARAAAYARHRDYLSVLFNRETMEPLIAGPPFVRALEELVQTAKLNPAGAAELTPQQCVDLVINGEATMAIGFLDHRTKTLPTSSIFVAELPGSDTAYHWGHGRWEPRRADETGRVTLRGLGGRIGAVVRGTDQAENTFLLLSWLASKHGSEELMTADVDFQPFRVSQFAAPQALAVRIGRSCSGENLCGSVFICTAPAGSAVAATNPRCEQIHRGARPGSASGSIWRENVTASARRCCRAMEADHGTLRSPKAARRIPAQFEIYRVSRARITWLKIKLKSPAAPRISFQPPWR